jgi:CRP-like cAMP-binding protein
VFAVTTDQLAEAPAFDGLDHDTLEAIASRGLYIWVPAGQAVVKAGESGFDFYVILSGDADVVSDDVAVARLGAGDVFGEMALIDGGKRTADVVARTPLSLMTMTSWNYRSVTKQFPALADRLMQLARSRQSTDG